MKKHIISLSITLAVLNFPVPPAQAKTQPVIPLEGNYEMFLDRAKQTLNGRSVNTDRPLTQSESFSTSCNKKGCLARSPNKRPPPAFFIYRWQDGAWVSVAGQQKQFLLCRDGSKVASLKFDRIKPQSDGSFSGERTILVKGKGCPGEGPGKYWLPFTLTPVKKAD